MFKDKIKYPQVIYDDWRNVAYVDLYARFRSNASNIAIPLHINLRSGMRCDLINEAGDNKVVPTEAREHRFSCGRFYEGEGGDEAARWDWNQIEQ